MPPDAATVGPARRRPGRDTVAILVVALVAAAWTIARAQGAGSAPGSMGMGPGAFVAMWSIMMAAMMLPSMAPVATRYLRSLSSRPGVRGTLFVAGYVLVWAASGLGAWALAVLADLVVARGETATRLLAALVLAAAAVYNLTPVKARLLGRCRNPLGLLLQYAGHRGPSGDLRAGLHHGRTCLGCCWSLMALMMLLGAMNVAAMVVLALVVAVEKLWSHGLAFARGVGVTCALLAVAVLAVPGVGAGLVDVGATT